MDVSSAFAKADILSNHDRIKKTETDASQCEDQVLIK